MVAMIMLRTLHKDIARYNQMDNSVTYVTFLFSIMNSLVIVLFLSGMVAMIMLRTLHKDIARYNQMDNSVSNSV